MQTPYSTMPLRTPTSISTKQYTNEIRYRSFRKLAVNFDENL